MGIGVLQPMSRNLALYRFWELDKERERRSKVVNLSYVLLIEVFEVAQWHHRCRGEGCKIRRQRQSVRNRSVIMRHHILRDHGQAAEPWRAVRQMANFFRSSAISESEIIYTPLKGVNQAH